MLAEESKIQTQLGLKKDVQSAITHLSVLNDSNRTSHSRTTSYHNSVEFKG